MRMKHALCKTCGKGFEKPEKSHVKTCSRECLAAAGKKKKKCIHGCTDTAVRQVRFKDGTVHNQQYCHNCLSTRFVPFERESPAYKDFDSNRMEMITGKEADRILQEKLKVIRARREKGLLDLDY